MLMSAGLPAIGNEFEASAATKMAAPVLVDLTYTPVSGHCNVRLTWKAVKGSYYQVLRKTPTTKYRVCATVRATSTTGVYSAVGVGKNVNYTYTVRRILKNKKGTRITAYGNYDSAGLLTLSMPEVTVDYNKIGRAHV